MKNMRELINLMEGVAAIPGLGESPIEEKAPPGMEDTVMDLKKQYPGEEEKAFATAWSIYNKKHGKTEEGVEDGVPSDDIPGDMNEPTEPSFDDVRVGQALDMFQNLVDSFVEPQAALDQVMDSYREQGASEDELAAIEDAIMDHHGVDVVGDQPDDSMDGDFDSAMASAGFGTDEDYGDYGGGDEFEESIDLNNGYDDVKCANGEDFFPDGADSPVVDATGTSGARQGDNPEQKKLQIAEVHKELVYSYRNFLKESGVQKKKLNEAQNRVVHVIHIIADKSGNPEEGDLYTMTDGQGNYPLSTDGEVFWASDANNPNIQQLDGQPHSTGKDLYLFSVDGKIGLYDGNFQLKQSFRTLGDFLYDYQQDPNFASPYKIVY